MARPRNRPQPKRPPGATKGTWSRRILLYAAGTGLVIGVLLIFLRNTPTPPKGTKASIPQSAGASDERTLFAAYGTSASCKDCHEEEFQAWARSNHALAERIIEPAADREAFEPPRTLAQGNEQTTVEWDHGKPKVTTIGQAGKPETYPVARVIGNDPLRQFLVAFAGGRWQALAAAYDPHSNQWFNVFGREERAVGEWGHWTGRGMNWNYMCAACHNTRLRRNYDEATDTYRTAMAEMSVGCEACHGPLKSHNEWQRTFGKTDRKDPTVAHFSKSQVLDYCGTCHARRTELTVNFVPGDKLLDHYDPVTVDQTERYYADGQVRDEDYEYSSFLGSRMHERGVYCLDCHNPHTMKTTLPGNWLCLRCHAGGDTNAPVINPVTHSHHKVFGFDTNGQAVNLDLTGYRPREIKETGGECVNCHMPQTIYMQRHLRHDHGFTCPDPLLTKQFAIPNACNRCHTDKDADWALRFCAEWYGAKMERPARVRAQAIARAQKGEAVAGELLALMAGEGSGYWHATEAALLGRWAERPEVTRALVAELEHTNALVRTAAAKALEPALATGDAGVAPALLRRLQDPVRSVRIAAASALGPRLPADSPVTGDYREVLHNQADEPSGQMQQGMDCFARNDLETALKHFAKAAEWDPLSAPIREELAVALSAANRNQEAVEQLKAACGLAPRDAECHYKLGLALNEVSDPAGAASELRRAVELDPQHASAWYNLGLAQNALGQSESAIESLLRAEASQPSDPRIPFARATILARTGQRTEARAAARRALSLSPDYTQAKDLLEQLSEK